MKVSYEWLQSFFDEPLPPPEKVVELLTFHVFEIESAEKIPSGDTMLDVKVLPDRACYALSHRGIAYELSAILDTSLKNDPLRKSVDIATQSKKLALSSIDAKLCPRYSAAVLRGVEVKPSPEWLRKRLEAIGQRSINNVVDATNYIMFTMGQPLHAFDAGKLTQRDGKWAIGVRGAHADEEIVTLDGETRDLVEGMALITDAHTDLPIGIAGIKGGRAAEITEATTDIVIESANFNSTNTRKTSQILGLRTDASVRFENKVAPELTVIALNEAVALISELAGGECEGYADRYPRPREPHVVGLTLAKTNMLLGTSLTQKEVSKLLARLGFPCRSVHPVDNVLALAPSLEGKPYLYGASVTYDAPNSFDCSSLVAYLYAQSGVRMPRMAADQYLFGTPVEYEDLQPGDVVFADRGAEGSRERIESLNVEQVRRTGVSQEFMPGTPLGASVDHNGVYLGGGKVIHAEGKSGRGAVVIDSLADSEWFKNVVGYRRMSSNDERCVIDVPAERLDLRIEEDVIEEVGRLYGLENIPATSPSPATNPIEINARQYWGWRVRSTLSSLGWSEIFTTSFAVAGDVRLVKSLASDKQYLRPNLSGNMQEALTLNIPNIELLGLDALRLFEIGIVFTKKEESLRLALGTRTTKKALSTADIRALLEKELALSMGPYILSDADGVLEIDFGACIDALPQPAHYEEPPAIQQARYRPFSRYPYVLRDVALWAPAGTNPEAVESLIRNHAGSLLVRARLFDTFEKGERVSFAFRLVFQSFERTLTDEEVNAGMKTTTDALTKAGYEIR